MSNNQRKNLEMLIQEGLANLSGEVLTLNTNLERRDILILTKEKPDTDITRVVINSSVVYLMSDPAISLKEIIVKSPNAQLYLRNIPDNCKIVVKEKAKLMLLTNIDKNNRLTLADPIELGPTEGE
jgi:hypothetical protein